uniref:Uncharacterized protein LOC105121582 n=2 Tax=Rhizophora mucronata TaxID=61149 RepID=A0A2P2J712_RHIMU
MRFLKRIAGFLGFVRDDGGQELRDHQSEEDNDNDGDHDYLHHHRQQPQAGFKFQETGLPRKGFSVPVQVAVDRPCLRPVLLPCTSGDGGVQGLKWYTKRLRMDEDGDVADEFLDEVLPEESNVNDQHKPLPRFKVNYNTRPVKIKKQVMTQDGKIQQCVEYQGRLQWV